MAWKQKEKKHFETETESEREIVIFHKTNIFFPNMQVISMAIAAAAAAALLFAWISRRNADLSSFYHLNSFLVPLPPSFSFFLLHASADMMRKYSYFFATSWNPIFFRLSQSCVVQGVFRSVSPSCLPVLRSGAGEFERARERISFFEQKVLPLNNIGPGWLG